MTLLLVRPHTGTEEERNWSRAGWWQVWVNLPCYVISSLTVLSHSWLTPFSTFISLFLTTAVLSYLSPLCDRSGVQWKPNDVFAPHKSHCTEFFFLFFNPMKKNGWECRDVKCLELWLTFWGQSLLRDVALYACYMAKLRNLKYVNTGELLLGGLLQACAPVCEAEQNSERD